MFETVNTKEKLLTEKVADQIVNLITNQNLVGGQRLPNEFELASSLNVGRGTVREAIKLLISRNVVEIHRGKGTFVCSAPGVVEDPLGLSFIKDKYKLALDLIQIRQMIEPQNAALAALNAKEADIEKMYQLATEIMELAKREEKYIDLDNEFHMHIAKLTENQVMPKLIPIIVQGIELFNYLPYHVERMDALQYHFKIVDAIRDKDAQRASDMMKEHLSYNIRNLEAIKTNL